MTKTLPNFLIVGAAKSGTTSLYHYLNEHPDIFLSELKEPKFITSQFINTHFGGNGDDGVEKKLVKDFSSYKRLFTNCNKYKCIGEASADTLYYHKSSIATIKHFFPSEPHIIIILRNPIERAYSSYSHLIRDKRETQAFGKSLDLEMDRINKNYEFIWHYKKVGLYYEQVKSFLENFKDVKIFLFDDLLNNPKVLLKDLFSFLGVDPEFKPDNINTIYNPSGIHKSKFVAKILLNRSIIKTIIKLLLPTDIKKQLYQKINHYNLKKVGMLNSDREYLLEFYKDDINKLGKLINKDLKHWLI